MKGQLLIRKTGQKDKLERDVVILLGIVAFDGQDEEIYKDGFKYDILDVIANNGEDYSELNNTMSPEDLLEEKIWRISK